jgi:hypothetical protein
MSKTGNLRVYNYGFRRHIDINDIQDTLTLAIIGAENLHGRSRVRLDGWWRLDRQRRRCVIDASTEVGETIARLFTGYLAKEFGESAFTVRRPQNGARQKEAPA